MNRATQRYCSAAVSLLSLLGTSEANAFESFAHDTHYAAIGDSITHAGRYLVYLETFYLTRFPDREIEMLNLGIAGDTASGALTRFSWDIEPLHAGVASVMFGMNDVTRSLYEAKNGAPHLKEKRAEKIREFRLNLASLVKKLTDDGTKVVVVSPTIFDEFAQMESATFPGLDAALAECGRAAKSVALQFRVPFVDVHSPMKSLSDRMQNDSPSATIVGPDRVHPQAPGHLFLMSLILKAQEVPSTVARVKINASTGTIEKVENCIVDDVKLSADAIAFRYRARCLPFPIEEEAGEALKWIPFTEEYNQEILTIPGLRPGRYSVTIDDSFIREYSADELARGVNFALEQNTPQLNQARKVLALISEREAIVRKRRDVLMVEIQAAKDIKRPVTLAQILPLLPARLKAAAGQPWESYIRRTGEEYLENKPQEEGFLVTARQLLHQARDMAKPRPHLIKIESVKLAKETGRLTQLTTLHQ